MGESIEDELWMREALREAECAEALGEVPVGAVLVDPDERSILVAGMSPAPRPVAYTRVWIPHVDSMPSMTTGVVVKG